MMRKLILFGLLVTSVLPACAVEKITVAQLEQMTAAAMAQRAGVAVPLQRLQDDGFAYELGNLLLTERLSPERLAQDAKKFSVGPMAMTALQLLSARSALLDPPDDELPAIPPPDAETQRRMIQEAQAFVFHTLKRLPNFFATRTTIRAEGTTQDLNKNGLVMRRGLTVAGKSSREITYRNGQEVIDPMRPGGPSNFAEEGLESWGEFGPEPAIVLIDAQKGTISFHHWERTATGAIAVYRYSVVRTNSHYEVSYSCMASDSFHDVPGYHGSLGIDPASGAILRITVEADWTMGDPITHVASVTEYGPVNIGERVYISPLRSEAFMVEEPSANCAHNGHSHLRRLDQPRLLLNQSTFSDFHRLGSAYKVFYKDEELPLPANNSQSSSSPTPAQPKAAEK